MLNDSKITDRITYIGTDDVTIDLFESQYKVPNGISYNSYLLLDDKVAVFDTVDARKRDDWFNNLSASLNGRTPDYLIISHMEPDHSALIEEFVKRYPSVTLVGNAKTFVLLDNFSAKLYDGKKLVVKEGDILDLGQSKLSFIMAPMVHWPEVMMTFELTDGTLFSADAFGTFGVSGATDIESWTPEARRYYLNIVGKYGTMVQSVLKKASALDVKRICPLHGPVLRDNLQGYIEKYLIWSSYSPEEKGVTVACASIHGHTKHVAEDLVKKLRENGVKTEFFDLCRDDQSAALASAFRFDNIVLAACTYDGGIFTPMNEFLVRLKSKNFCERTTFLIENGSWAPQAGKIMTEALAAMKNVTVDGLITVRSAPTAQTATETDELVNKIKEKTK